VAKKRVGKFPKAFRPMAVARLEPCDNTVALAKAPGISRRLLYSWREQLEPLDSGDGPPGTSREATLRKEVSRLKRVLAEKVLEVDETGLFCWNLTGGSSRAFGDRTRNGWISTVQSPARQRAR